MLTREFIARFYNEYTANGGAEYRFVEQMLSQTATESEWAMEIRRLHRVMKPLLLSVIASDKKSGLRSEMLGSNFTDWMFLNDVLDYEDSEFGERSAEELFAETWDELTLDQIEECITYN